MSKLSKKQLQDGAVDSTVIENDSVESVDIKDGTIVDADISASAAISLSKLSTASGTDGDTMVLSGGVWAPVTGSGGSHAITHVNGTDDIQNATAAQKGLATAAQIAKLDGIELLADVTDAGNVDAAGAVMNSDTTTASMSFVVNEGTLVSNLATKVPTQQSVKTYVDNALLLLRRDPYNTQGSTTAIEASPATYRTWSITNLPAGTYKFDWSLMWAMDNKTNSATITIWSDGVQVGYMRKRPINTDVSAAGQREPFSGTTDVTFATTATRSFQVQYYVHTLGTLYIFKSYMSLLPVRTS